MMTLTIRDFRTRPAAVRRDLAHESEALLTANGKPFALVTPVTTENATEVSKALRMARAQLVVREIRKAARANGTDKLTMTEIGQVIAATRTQRRAANRRTGR